MEYIVYKWKQEVINYVNQIHQLGTKNVHISLNIWKNNKFNHNHYFWFHYLFGDLYQKDNQFQQTWDSTPKLSVDGPHFLQHKGLANLASDEVIDHINNKQTPLYKLTYRYQKKSLVKASKSTF